MPSRVRCFMLTPTDQVAVSLRRFASPRDGAPRCGRQAPRYPGAEVLTYEAHDVEIEIERRAGTLERSIDGDHTQRTIAVDDPRWPTRCACGFEFTAEHMKQESHTRLHRRSDTGELVTRGDAPAGAMYLSETFGDVGEYNRHRAGESLVVKTPAGEWMLDGPASNGPGWNRTGELPDIVVTPSIGIGHPQRLHGWLGGPDGKSPGWLVIDKP